MTTKTENTEVQAKKEYQSPTLTNQGSLEQKTLNGGLGPADGPSCS